MVYILRSVLMGLHRFAPPSDKAELDESVRVPRGGVYGPTSGPRHSVRFQAPVSRRILRITFGVTTQDKKTKPGAPVSSMLALARPKRPRSTSCSRESKEWAIADRSDGVNC